MNLEFVFESSDHIRYEYGRMVSGPHGGANRAVKIEPVNNSPELYSVTIYNRDGAHPLWKNNIQMAPKQMKIVKQSSDRIILLGTGYDDTGTAYSDYGLTINFQDEEISNCVLHLHNRGVDLKYLP